MQKNKDVIFALSSGAGKAGIAVIRVSGGGLDFLSKPLKPRIATLVDFYGIDRIIAIYFPAPNSFTGEDIVELHAHGGIAVINKIFEKLKAFGFRMAERGEFSRRAFDNGKMDLTEVEGMRALIDSRTERQRIKALHSMTGSDAEVYIGWRSDMIEIAALAAARLDYAEDDLPKNINEQIAKKTQDLISKINGALKSSAHKIEVGYKVAFVGDTNVGKSSLFNRLLGESRAIVSDIAGTTRDVITAEIDIDGYLVCLADTAGIRESKDEIENIGIGKTHQEIFNADLVFRVVSAEDGKREPQSDKEIVLYNKADLVSQWGANYVSAKTGAGLDKIYGLIKTSIEKDLASSESDVVVNERVKMHLKNAVVELEKSRDSIFDLQAEHIGNAASEIGQILGIIGSEDIYDSVFGQLCLGK